VKTSRELTSSLVFLSFAFHMYGDGAQRTGRAAGHRAGMKRQKQFRCEPHSRTPPGSCGARGAASFLVCVCVFVCVAEPQ
jgi:hypothetical protein